MENIGIVEPILSAAGGSFLGVLIAYLALKSRLDNLEKAIGSFVNEKECSARHMAMSQRIDNAANRFDRIDTKLEVMVQMLMKGNYSPSQKDANK